MSAADLGPGLILALAFVAGSIPFGWIIARLWGVADLRQVGSANIGATNVTRTAGKLPGALTFLLDALKSFFPVLYATPETAAWVGFAAVAGHCFSPFLKFRGGKGVSTTFGALLALNPWLGGASLLTYVLGLAVTRTSALGSLFAMLTALTGALLYTAPTSQKLAVLLIVLVVLSRHRDNWDKQLAAKPLLVLALLFAAAAVKPSAYAVSTPLQLKDFRGRPVALKPVPQRIAALIPSVAETVIDLGAGDRLVAAPEYSRLPAKLKNVKTLGPYNRLSAEAIYATKPDLVLASMDGNDSVLVEQLEKLGLRVVTVNSQSLDDIYRSTELIAAAVGADEKKKLLELKQALSPLREALRSSNRHPRVFVQVGWDPLVTISKATFIDELVRYSGGKTIFENSAVKYPRPNPEEVVAANPEIIVICQLTDEGDEARKAKEFWSRFKGIEAVKSGKIYVIPGDWLTKPGFALIKGARELYRIML